MLEQLRILIVEDEPLIALDLETAIGDHAGVVVGPAHAVDYALRLIDGATLDGAIIDLRLNNQSAIPVADRLIARGIPFIVYSGTADAQVAQSWPAVQLIGKPAAPEVVIAALAAAIRDHL